MIEGLRKEVNYKTSRSSGAGGQHVNKVSTRVELIFNISTSTIFTEEQKDILLIKLDNRLTKEGLLRLQCDETRSQIRNKEIVFERFILLITNAMKPKKERKPTKPTKSSIEKRLAEKRIKSAKKDLRKNITDE